MCVEQVLVDDGGHLGEELVVRVHLALLVADPDLVLVGVREAGRARGRDVRVGEQTLDEGHLLLDEVLQRGHLAGGVLRDAHALLRHGLAHAVGEQLLEVVEGARLVHLTHCYFLRFALSELHGLIL